MRKQFLIPLVLVVAIGGSYSLFTSYLRDQDSSLSDFISGAMLNFYGGEQDQLIRVNLYNHSIALYEKGSLYKLAKIAGTGNPASKVTATPTGQFRILSKDKWHISGISGVIMPLSLRFFGGYFFHDIPLYPNGKTITTKYSGGCIRLPPDLARLMFDWANVGAYVEIYDAKLARADNSQTVYLLTEDGYRQPFASSQALLAHGYQFKDVAVVTPPEIDGLPLGNAIN